MFTKNAKRIGIMAKIRQESNWSRMVHTFQEEQIMSWFPDGKWDRRKGELGKACERNMAKSGQIIIKVWLQPILSKSGEGFNWKIVDEI